nr:unnamed protein product [Haemonchus contortus]
MQRLFEFRSLVRATVNDFSTIDSPAVSSRVLAGGRFWEKHHAKRAMRQRAIRDGVPSILFIRQFSISRSTLTLIRNSWPFTEASRVQLWAPRNERFVSASNHTNESCVM